MNTNNIVMWEIPQSNADWDCFRSPILREILKIQNPLLEEHCGIFGSYNFCSNKLDGQETKLQILKVQQNLKLSHWDTGLRLDGLPALEPWDLIVSVLGNVSRVFRWIRET